MKKVLSFAIVATTLLTYSCGSNTQTSAADDAATTTEHEHEHASEGLQLNDGAKWEIAEGMQPPLKAMSAALKNYTGTTLEDGHALATSLGEHLNTLVSNCTMSGAAHDELHKWLVPFMEANDGLAAATTAEEANEAVLVLKTAIEEFENFFG